MTDLTVLTTFLGWCTVISLIFLMVTSLILVLFREPIKSIHNKLLGVEKDHLNALYFSYLSRFKLAVIIFNLTPYLALKLMT
ncbi:MAG: hypothetical protein COB22_03575 [Cycloclasticus sp.]|nr:MAG: hypothetical protein COB22_03575 [Cycloclasticus sp.]